MADRRRQVVLLIASRMDGFFLPGGALRTRSGFAPGDAKPCPVCGVSASPGWVVDRFKRRSPCVQCGGAPAPSGKRGQWVKADAGRGVVAFDAMDPLELPVGSVGTFATARPRATVRCDSCGGDGAHGNGVRCEVCGGSGRRELYVFELRLDRRAAVSSGDPLTDAVEERLESGSYAELERALERLRAESRWAHGALLAAVDAAVWPLPARLEAALEFVASRMPEKIVVPAQVVANARVVAEHRRRVKGRGVSAAALAQRDADIRKAVRKGVPVQRVAFEYGLSVSQVNRVANGEAA